MTSKEALEKLKYSCGSAIFYEDFRLFDIIETALNRLDELEKVLEIIKEKKISCLDIERSVDTKSYNIHLGQTTWVHDYLERKLTEEEFNTLKRFLK